MLKVITVDDEQLVRSHLRILVEELGCAIELIGELRNGHEAIDFIADGNVPDIIITDIRMPVMDGIELVRQAGMIYPGIRSIIISGYSDFEYAREAIHLGVTEYILKPIKREDLHRAVNKISSEIEILRQNSIIQQNYESIQQERSWQEISQLLGEIIYAEHFNDVQSSTLVSKLHIQGNVEFVVCLLISCHDMYYLRKLVMEKYFEIINTQVLFTQSRANPREIAVLMTCSKSGMALNGAVCFGNQCLAALDIDVEKKVIVSISQIHCNFDEIRTAYKEAYEAAGQRFINGFGRVYVNRGPDLLKTAAFQTYLGKIHSLASYLEQNNKKSIFDDFERLLTDLFRPEILKNMSFSQLKYLFVEIVHSVSSYCNRINLDVRKYFESADLSGEVLDNMYKCEEIVQFLIKKIGTIIDEIPAFNQKQENLIAQVQDYVRNNFFQEIYLEQIADMHNISAIYLSRVFKETTGISFVDFLTEIRIGFAKGLLEDTHVSIQEVAYQTGYTDHHYFHRVFKKQTGITPNEYRNRALFKKSNR